MTTLIKAAGVDVEPIWTTLFARALEGINVSRFSYWYDMMWLVQARILAA